MGTSNSNPISQLVPLDCDNIPRNCDPMCLLFRPITWTQTLVHANRLGSSCNLCFYYYEGVVDGGHGFGQSCNGCWLTEQMSVPINAATRVIHLCQAQSVLPVYSSLVPQGLDPAICRNYMDRTRSFCSWDTLCSTGKSQSPLIGILEQTRPGHVPLDIQLTTTATTSKAIEYQKDIAG